VNVTRSPRAFRYLPLLRRWTWPDESGLTQDPGARSARDTVALSLVGKLAELPPLALMFTIVPRVLGPSRFGEFTLGFFAVTLGSACVATSGAALMSRFIATAAPGDRVQLAHRLARDLARRRLVQAALLGVLGTLLSVTLPDRFPPVFTVIVVLALAVDLMATLCFQIALGLGRTRLWSFRYAVQNSTTLVATLLLTAAFGGSAAVGGLLTGSAAALLLGAFFVIRPLLRARRAEPGNEQRTLSPEITRFRTFKGLSNLLTQLAHRSGVILVAIVSGSRVETGYAGLATGAGLTATYAIWQTFTVQLPAHSAQTTRDHLRVEEVLRRYAQRLQLVAVVLALGVAAILTPVFSLLFGDRFLGARDAFAPAIALIPLAPMTALGSQIATLRLRPDIEARATGLGAVIFFAVALTAIPFWGAGGATSALLASSVATVGALAVGLQRAISLRMIAVGLMTVAAVLAIRVVA
jgi:O-antigen/teichoic acid export membrane protein